MTPVFGPRADKRRADMQTFGHELIASGDIDPAYPVLKWLAATYAGDKRAGQNVEVEWLWLTYLYLAYYSLPSALAAFSRVGFPGVEDVEANAGYLADLPCGVERRGNRGGRVVPFLLETLRHVNINASSGDLPTWKAFYEWFKDPALDPYLARMGAKARYNQVIGRLEAIKGNGRWAAFKWADLMKNVLGYGIAAPDTGMKDSTGPLDGLKYVYDLPEDASWELLTDAERTALMDCMDAGAVDWEQTETILCNYGSLAKGNYYLGHDIDEQLQGVREARQRREISAGHLTSFLDAREASFPKSYLGERVGRDRVDRNRKKAYAVNGQILAFGPSGKTVQL